MTFDLLHASVFARPVLLVKQLYSFAAQQHERERVIDIRFAEVQRIAISLQDGLIEALAVACEVLNYFRLHAVCDYRYVIVGLDEALHEACG